MAFRAEIGPQNGKELWDVVETQLKIEIVMAELEYRHLGFYLILVSSIKKRYKKELAKMDKIEKHYFDDQKCREKEFEIDSSEFWALV